MLTRSLSLLPLALLLSTTFRGPSAQDDLLSSGAVREVVVDGPPGTRVEYFRLDHEVPEGTISRRRPAPVGLVRWVSGPDPEVASGWRSEIDVRFLAERTRVLHTESLRPERRELIFREIGQFSGRTVRLGWTPDGRAELHEADGGDVRRRVLDLGGGAYLPLSLVELVRRGERWEAGGLRVFQPVAGELATLDLEVVEASASTVAGPGSTPTLRGGRRILQLRRGEHDAGRYEFEGEDLVQFRWQSGGLVATRVGRGVHGEWREAAEARAAGLPEPEPETGEFAEALPAQRSFLQSDR